MKRAAFFFITLFLFNSCTSIVKYYEISPKQFPEWILYEYPNFIGERNRDKYEYNQNIFFICQTQTAGINFTSLNLVINPKMQFENLNIIEINYIRDGKEVTLNGIR
jgi:hypothetical protein